MTVAFNYLGKLGQLGNQMFKFAALRGISYSNNQDYMMPPSHLLLNNRTFFKVFLLHNIICINFFSNRNNNIKNIK